MMRRNAIVDKSKELALEIIRLYRNLVETKREFVLSKQMVRSGTSIGANVREAQRGQSKNDFISKMQIAQKEADETAYWLELLLESGYMTKEEISRAYDQSQEILKLLSSIILKSKSSTIHNS